MSTITVHDAKTHFSQLIDRALAGEEIVVARRKKPVVKIVPLPEAQEKRVLGRGKDLVEWMSPDFDEPLEDFKEYMP